MITAYYTRSLGGLYGRMRIDQLGKVQPDTRNPVLSVAMETLGEAENRCSGIPTMRRELERAGIAEPELRDARGTFVVCLRKSEKPIQSVKCTGEYDYYTAAEKLLHFCAVPRRQEVADFLHIKSATYAIKAHVLPLVEQGLLTLSLPDKPRRPKQRYRAKQL